MVSLISVISMHALVVFCVLAFAFGLYWGGLIYILDMLSYEFMWYYLVLNTWLFVTGIIALSIICGCVGGMKEFYEKFLKPFSNDVIDSHKTEQKKTAWRHWIDSEMTEEELGDEDYSSASDSEDTQDTVPYDSDHSDSDPEPDYDGGLEAEIWDLRSGEY